MYYDRSIDKELVAALAPDGPLAWLMAHVRSDMGRRHHVHLEFRKTRSGYRQRGSVQLYWGRTSPLEIQLHRNNCARLNANKTYRTISEPLFTETFLLSRLGQREGDLRAYGQLHKSVQTLLNQKQDAAVIPQGGPALCKTARLVPWLATPDDSADRPAGWLEAIRKCSKNLSSSFLSDLTLVRLDEHGSILEAQSL